MKKSKIKKPKNWIAGALTGKKGALRKTAIRKGLLRSKDEKLSMTDLNKLQKVGGTTGKRAVLAKTFRKFDGGGVVEKSKYQYIIDAIRKTETTWESGETFYRANSMMSNDFDKSYKTEVEYYRISIKPLSLTKRIISKASRVKPDHKVTLEVGDIVVFEQEIWSKNGAMVFAKKIINEVALNIYEQKPYRFVKFKNGGIANNYEKKSGLDVWTLWSISQRKHFLKDHNIKNADDISNMEGDEVPESVRKKLEIHMKEGQYKSGGSVGEMEVKVRNLDDNTISDWTLNELVERINEDNASGGVDYDTNDWVDGFNDTLTEFYSLNDEEGKPLNDLTKYAKGGSVGSSFNKDTEVWYDSVVDSSGEINSGDNLLKAIILTDKEATKENLKKLRDLIKKIPYSASAKKALDSQINKILTGKYKDEFKYTFGGKRKSMSKVSATSSFFSAFNQASTYNFDFANGGGVDGINVDEVVNHFIDAMLFASIDDEGNSLDSNYDRSSVSDETKKEIKKSVIAFINKNKSIIKKNGISEESLGHDLFYTPQGHGVGFWDRGYGDDGEVLSESSKKYFTSDSPYVGDDGKVYLDSKKYKNGGGVGNFFNKVKVHAKDVSSTLSGKAKHGYNKAKTYTEDKIKEKKRSIAIDVLQETRNKINNKHDSIFLNEATNIIESKYKKGGVVGASDLVVGDTYKYLHEPNTYVKYLKKSGNDYTFVDTKGSWIGITEGELPTSISEVVQGSKSVKKPKISFVKKNIFNNGEIMSEILESYLGHKPSYPIQVIEGMKFEKCFLRNRYRLIS